MPKKQDKYDDALGSIFDFVFANNKSKKSKGFQYKPSGASGTDELTRALAEIASKPGILMADSAINSINETFFDAKLAQFYLDQEDLDKHKFNYDRNAGRFRVRLSDVGKALSDPRGYVGNIDKKLKQQQKWVRLTGASAMLDSAAAIGIGMRNGMNVSDAWKFGKAARMTYDPQMVELQKELVANNAASEAVYERAKRQALREGLDRTSDDYERRVFELVNGIKADVKDDSKHLYEAMRSSSAARRAKYFEDDKAFMNARSDVEAYLRKKIGYSTQEQKDRVDALVASLDGELSYSRTHGGKTISGYRMAYSKNQHLRAELSDSHSEVENSVRAGALSHGWERIKGSGEYADITTALADINNEIELLKEDRSDPNNAALAASLEVHRTRLLNIRDEQARRSMRSKEYWRAPVNAFPRRPDRKLQ